jgi:hypothetical protein
MRPELIEDRLCVFVFRRDRHAFADDEIGRHLDQALRERIALDQKPDDLEHAILLERRQVALGEPFRAAADRPEHRIIVVDQDAAGLDHRLPRVGVRGSAPAGGVIPAQLEIEVVV